MIYFDNQAKNVMCRRWNWRNGDNTKIETATRQIIINLDALPPVSPEQVREASDELAELLEQHCGAKLEKDVLYAEKRELELNF